MSWRNSVSLVFISLWLTACGFTPMYSKNPTTEQANLAGVIIETPAGRSGQLLKADLEDRLNPRGGVPAKPAYLLKTTLSSTTTPIGVARDGTVSRYNIYLTSNYTLYRNSDGKEVTSGSVTHINSYNNVVSAYYSTYISEQDAIRRSITELAELYRGRLASYLVRKP